MTNSKRQHNKIRTTRSTKDMIRVDKIIQNNTGDKGKK